MNHDLLIFLALVPILGVTAQLIAYWTRLPSILLLLSFGIVLGSFINLEELFQAVPSGVAGESSAARLLSPIVSLSVAVILFEGGLSLRFSEFKKSGRAVIRLITIGG